MSLGFLIDDYNKFFVDICDSSGKKGNIRPLCIVVPS